MIVNKTTISAVFQTLNAAFNKAFAEAPSIWEEIAMKVPSSSGQNVYPHFDRFPKMRKWVGEKFIKALKAYKYTVVNDDFEATVEVDRNDMKDDNMGMYGPMAQEAGFSSKQLPDEIVAGDLVNGAFANACYDEQYFCDTDHPVEDGNGNVSSVSNKGTAALSVATLAAAQASLGVGMSAMMAFKDNEGRPLGVIPNILMVPPALRETANVLANNKELEDGKPNPYKGTFKVVVNPWMTSTTAWFLLCTTRPVKPFIYQEREAPVFVSQTDLNSDDVFMRKKFKFGSEARAAGAYGFWQLGYGSTGAA